MIHRIRMWLWERKRARLQRAFALALACNCPPDCHHEYPFGCDLNQASEDALKEIENHESRRPKP